MVYLLWLKSVKVDETQEVKVFKELCGDADATSLLIHSVYPLIASLSHTHSFSNPLTNYQFKDGTCICRIICLVSDLAATVLGWV